MNDSDTYFILQELEHLLSPAAKARYSSPIRGPIRPLAVAQVDEPLPGRTRLVVVRGHPECRAIIGVPSAELDDANFLLGCVVLFEDETVMPVTPGLRLPYLQHEGIVTIEPRMMAAAEMNVAAAMRSVRPGGTIHDLLRGSRKRRETIPGLGEVTLEFFGSS